MSAMPEKIAASDLGKILSIRGDPDIGGQLPQVLEEGDVLHCHFAADVHVKHSIGSVDVTHLGGAFGNLMGRHQLFPAIIDLNGVGWWTRQKIYLGLRAGGFVAWNNQRKND